MADHASAAADVPFGNRPAARAVERLEHVLVAHMESVDVVQPAVVGFGNDRQSPRLQSGPRYLPFQNRVPHDTNAVRIRDRDGTLEESALVDPRRASHLAVAVEREPRREHRIRALAAARVHDRDARANRSLADDERTLARDERGMPDFDAGDVGDGVERARRAADQRADPELARAGFAPRT